MNKQAEANILFTVERIEQRVREMVEKIELDYRDKDLVLVAVLKGSVLFLADLVRGFSRPLAFDFIGVSSYGHSRTSLGVVNLEKEISADIRGKDVLVVEIKDKPGELGKLAQKMANAEVNIDFTYLASNNRIVLGVDDLETASAAV